LYKKNLKLYRRVTEVKSSYDYFRWPAYEGVTGITGVKRYKDPVKEEERQRDVDIKALEKEFQERSEAAYKFGVEDGKAIGLEQGKQEVEEAVKYLKEMAEVVSLYKKEILKDADDIITRLAVSVAKMVIKQEVATDPGLIKEVVKNALKLVDDRKRISLKVNPEDWKEIENYEDEIRAVAHGVQELEIKEDETIVRGGCVIESDSGIVDAQIDSQLEEIRKVIKGNV